MSSKILAAEVIVKYTIDQLIDQDTLDKLYEGDMNKYIELIRGKGYLYSMFRFDEMEILDVKTIECEKAKEINTT